MSHTSSRSPLRLFYSYSHQDEELRVELEKHLSVLRRQGVISGWSDRRIEPGHEWAGEIDGQLDNADIVLLLVSADFLASDYCYDVEMTRAMDRHASGDARIIPILCRPCDWKSAPFGKLQALPTEANPVTLWSNPDAAFEDIARGIRLISEQMLRRNELRLEPPARQLERVEDETRRYLAEPPHTSPESARNPFAWRGGMAAVVNFFDRDEEQRTIRDYLLTRQNCQVVGPHCIGKTPLLKQVERAAANWNKQALVAYIDPYDPRCYSLSGWLDTVVQQCNWSIPATTLTDFTVRVVDSLERGFHPVLCLDEFEELTMRPSEFTREFFLALRFCGEKGMSIVTATRRPLSELFDPKDKLVSPFYTAFRALALGPFRPTDAEDFVNLRRPGTPAFTLDEKKAILEFAKGHPLALQVACFHMLEAKNRESISSAMMKAADEMKTILPRSW